MHYKQYRQYTGCKKSCTTYAVMVKAFNLRLWVRISAWHILCTESSAADHSFKVNLPVLIFSSHSVGKTHECACALPLISGIRKHIKANHIVKAPSFLHQEPFKTLRILLHSKSKTRHTMMLDLLQNLSQPITLLTTLLLAVGLTKYQQNVPQVKPAGRELASSPFHHLALEPSDRLMKMFLWFLKLFLWVCLIEHDVTVVSL